VNFRTARFRCAIPAGGGDFRQLPDAGRHREVEKLGAKIMEAITRVIPVLPVSLVGGRVCSPSGAGLSELELKYAAYDLIQRLERAGAISTFRAAISTMPSASACACCCCGTSW